MKAALVLAALVASAPAFAVSVSAEITDFQIKLIDLNTSDGIDPYLKFGSPAGTSTTLQYGGAAAFSTPTSMSVSGSSPVPAYFGGAASPFGTFMDPRHGLGTFGFQDFTLSPNTKLVMTGMGSVSAQGTTDPVFYGAWSEARMILATSYQTGNQFLSFADAVVVVPDGSSQSEAKSLLVSYSNTGSSEFSGGLAVFARAYAEGVSPIPEPRTYAMMLAGLAFIGAIVRRRPMRSGTSLRKAER